jgi:hypothetical protein
MKFVIWKIIILLPWKKNYILKLLWKLNIWINDKLDNLFNYDNFIIELVVGCFIKNKQSNLTIYTNSIINKNILNVFYKDVSTTYYRVLFNWDEYLKILGKDKLTKLTKIEELTNSLKIYKDSVPVFFTKNILWNPLIIQAISYDTNIKNILALRTSILRTIFIHLKRTYRSIGSSWEFKKKFYYEYYDTKRIHKYKKYKKKKDVFGYKEWHFRRTKPGWIRRHFP